MLSSVTQMCHGPLGSPYTGLCQLLPWRQSPSPHAQAPGAGASVPAGEAGHDQGCAGMEIPAWPQGGWGGCAGSAVPSDTSLPA